MSFYDFEVTGITEYDPPGEGLLDDNGNEVGPEMRTHFAKTTHAIFEIGPLITQAVAAYAQSSTARGDHEDHAAPGSRTMRGLSPRGRHNDAVGMNHIMPTSA